MTNPIQTILLFVVLALVASIVAITLALNVKSEGLGAAITGASDSYRGAVGIEEQKRRLLSYLCYGFVGVSFIYAILQTWL